MKICVPCLYSCKMESVLQSYISGPTCNLPSPYSLRNNGIKMISVLVAMMYSIIYSLLFVKLSSGLRNCQLRATTRPTTRDGTTRKTVVFVASELQFSPSHFFISSPTTFSFSFSSCCQHRIILSCSLPIRNLV